MNKEEAKDLAKKFLTGKATAEEKEKLHRWPALDTDDETEVVFTSRPENADDVKSRLFEGVQAKINLESLPVRDTKRTVFWYRMLAAAAILLVVGTSVYFYTADTNSFFRDDLADAKSIAIGKNAATLTLGNGKQINLSDALNGQLVEESGFSIHKTSDGQVVYEVKSTATGGDDRLNTISTPQGGQYKVVLPDGSKVWLNAASSIKFPSVFTKTDKRKVQLNGEAYFEVAKDKIRPFIVETGKQLVEVLGTHFNINAYNDDNSMKTTLLEGSIKVGLVNHEKEENKTEAFTILKPGQQSVLTDGTIRIVQADMEEAIAWKNGYFKFNSESLSTVMHQLSRWYDVEVVYEGEISKDRFGGTISRYKNVADVLEMLESTKLVKFKVEGRKIIVR